MPERFTGLITVAALAVGASLVRPARLHQPLVAVTVADFAPDLIFENHFDGQIFLFIDEFYHVALAGACTYKHLIGG